MNDPGGKKRSRDRALPKSGGKEKKMSQAVCFHCKEKGHMKDECKKRKKQASAVVKV